MIVKAYNTESSVNTINKVIDFVTDIDVKFKDELIFTIHNIKI